MTDVRLPPRRPIGITATCLVLVWVAAGAFGNAMLLPSALRSGVADHLLRFSKTITSSTLSGFALLFAVTALIAAIGLWRMSSWGIRAFLAWGVANCAGMLAFTVLMRSPPDTPAIAGIAFIAAFSGLLFIWWIYLKKAYERTGLRAL